MDPDPAIFFSDFQDDKKRKNYNFLKSFLAYYFLKVHLYNFSKMKSHKEVTKQQESKRHFMFPPAQIFRCYTLVEPFWEGDRHRSETQRGGGGHRKGRRTIL